MIKKVKLVIVLAVSLLFGYTLLRVNFSAQMGMIDDHEVVSFLGSDQKIYLVEMPQLLAKTEVGQIGHSLRFRPVYYTLRIVESMLWRDQATLWYGTRLAILTISLAMGWYLLEPLIGGFGAASALLYIMAWDYWKDIWTRLGPSEIYAVPAVLLFLIGLINILRVKKVKAWHWAALLVGFVVSVGSKENFFFLLIPLLLVIYKKWRTSSWHVRIFMLLTLTFGLAVTVDLYWATHLAGSNFYHESLSLPARLKLAFVKTPKLLYWYRALPLLLVSSGIGVITYRIADKLQREKLRKIAKYLSWVVAMLMIGISTQVFFYGDMWPSNNRYDFPGLLMIQGVSLAAAVWAIFSLKVSGHTRLSMLVKGILTVYLLIWTYQKGYYPIKNEAERNASRTNYFQAQLTQTRGLLDLHPDAAIIFVSNTPLAYEQIAAMRRYLLFYGYPDKMYFRYLGNKETDSLYGALADSMQGISRMGGTRGDDSWGFLPTEQFPANDCVALMFGEELNSECTKSLRLF